MPFPYLELPCLLFTLLCLLHSVSSYIHFHHHGARVWAARPPELPRPTGTLLSELLAHWALLWGAGCLFVHRPLWTHTRTLAIPVFLVLKTVLGM